MKRTKAVSGHISETHPSAGNEHWHTAGRSHLEKIFTFSDIHWQERHIETSTDH